MNENVLRGAQLLDKKRPNWYNEIDLEKLDIKSIDNCVLGQLYDYFVTGLDELGVDYSNASESLHGFDIHLESSHQTGQDVAYEQLRLAWIEEIKKRLNS